ncbi:MAG: DUF4148 domain-containing protein [Comamonadaceae bacterium]|nr:MAG: DUF4148 domain-containing protein [Comamonadaceae bacterium]
MTHHPLRNSAVFVGTICLLAGNAFAFQGEQYPQEPTSFQSSRTRAEVQAEAMNPVRISNGGTGVLEIRGEANRDAVRQQASLATRDGTAWYGEVDRKR